MELDLTTQIIGVTVYPDRAQVTRRGEVENATAGEHIVRIGGLPLAILRDSLRATGRGPAGMRILGVEQGNEVHPSAPEEALATVREQIERLEQELALRQERVQALEERQGWLRELGEQSARSLAWGMARGSAKPQDADAFFSYASESGERLSAEKQAAQQQIAETQRNLNAKRREFEMIGGRRPPDRLVASVRFELPEPGAVTIELSYLITGADWRPRYDARVDTTAHSVRLTQQALVSQRTGEDWSGVALALSTARPAAAVRLPDDVDPWYLDVFRPVPPPMPQPVARARNMKAAAMMSDASMPSFGAALQEPEAEYMTMAPAPPQAAALASAAMERSGSAQLFRLPGGVDIPSDGSPHLLGIGEFAIPARLDYIAQPTTAAGAHLRALATNSTGQALMPGELHIFQISPSGDEYVGQTAIELTAENAELPLYLGVDDNVTVKRELIERDTDKGILLQRGIRKVTLGYRVTLANRTAAPQRILLKDRLPVPRNERIKLNVLDLRPPPTSRTRLEQLTWELELAPNEERRIEWRFVVESPTESDITGMP